MTVRRIAWSPSCIAIVAIIALSSRADEPARTGQLPPQPSGQSSTDTLVLDFGRPCNQSAAAKDALDTKDAKRTPARQDPQHPFTRPNYPEVARLLGQEGQVVMLLLVSEEGNIALARIDRSSGYPLLDQAALEATRKWSILPGTLNGTPVCSWGRFAMNFHLSDYERSELAQARIRPGARHLLELIANFHLQDQVTRASGAASDDATSQALSALVLGSDESRANFDASLHDPLALISLQFSDEEIADAVKFFEGPVGEKVLRLQPELLLELKADFTPAFYATSCQVALLRQTVDKRHTAPGELPEALRSAVPRLLAESRSYCACAAKQPNWLDTMRAGKIASAGEAQICGEPPDLTW